MAVFPSHYRDRAPVPRPFATAHSRIHNNYFLALFIIACAPCVAPALRFAREHYPRRRWLLFNCAGACALTRTAFPAPKPTISL